MKGHHSPLSTTLVIAETVDNAAAVRARHHFCAGAFVSSWVSVASCLRGTSAEQFRTTVWALLHDTHSRSIRGNIRQHTMYLDILCAEETIQ